LTSSQLIFISRGQLNNNLSFSFVFLKENIIY